MNMKSIVKFVVGAGMFSATVLPAHALVPPETINIDGGPLGALQLTGGMTGYFYAVSGAGNSSDPGLLGTDKSVGAEAYTLDMKVTKPTGIVQFTVEVYPQNTLALGYKPTAPSLKTFTLGPVYSAYLTLAPTPTFSISAGQIPSVEGWELLQDFSNANVIGSPLYWVENSSSRGVAMTYNNGKVSATAMFGDGFDSGVFNTAQGIVTENFNANNMLSVYGAANLGRTGGNTFAYGGGTTGTGYDAFAPYVNSTLIGSYYSFTSGNLNIVPEVQYVYAKEDQAIGITKFTSSFGAEVIGDYQFGKSPWSLGSMLYYYTNNGDYGWYLNPHSAGVGFGLTPTWQHGHIFARAEGAMLHLTDVGYGAGFGADSNGRNQAMGILEGGVLF